MAFDTIRVDFNSIHDKDFWHTHSIPFVGNYFDLISHMVEDIRTTHFWLVASFVDVSVLDLDFIPEQHEAQQIHCFHSGENKEGNVLLIPKAEFNKQRKDINCLRDFRDINYHKVPGLDPPIGTIYYDLADITGAYNQFPKGRYTWLINNRLLGETLPDFFPSFWEQQKAYAFGQTKDMMLLPRKEKITQVYDFGNIVELGHDYPVKVNDIVFISYDEPHAVRRYEALKARYPRAKWVKNVKGQTQAYHTAARMSDTPYFFAVFPKIDIVDSFCFDFQPDRLKNPCHYIFDCHNTVIDCTYGHDGVILFNKKLVLETLEHGLDFSLSAPHTSVGILSAYNKLEDSPLIAWRTSFREVIKLCEQKDNRPTVEGNYRLNKWLTLGKGKYADWVHKGALDGKEFYQKHNSEMEKSYDFDYIKNFFEKKYAVKYS